MLLVIKIIEFTHIFGFSVKCCFNVVCCSCPTALILLAEEEAQTILEVKGQMAILLSYHLGFSSIFSQRRLMKIVKKKDYVIQL